ncbi:15-hydroxyprostaglandin dehydrogenase [NAD(+)]-like [Haemaphysalis longicornis]
MLNPDSAEVFAVNTVAVFKSIQLAFKYMSKAHGYNGGHVINLASNAAITPLHTAPAYTASKHAVLGMTRSFGCDLYWNRHSIRVNCLCPGPFRSNIFCDHMEYLKASDDTASLVDDCQKQCQEPEQVAHGVVKLLQDEPNGAALLCLKSVGFKYHDFPALPIA